MLKTDHFKGNQCSGKNCLPAQNPNNNVGYRIPCKLCNIEGKSSVYIGETGENMHVRYKSHLTKFNYKKGI